MEATNVFLLFFVVFLNYRRNYRHSRITVLWLENDNTTVQSINVNYPCRYDLNIEFSLSKTSVLWSYDLPFSYLNCSMKYSKWRSLDYLVDSILELAWCVWIVEWFFTRSIVWKFKWRVHHGAFSLYLTSSFWNRCITSMVHLLVEPHNSLPLVHIVHTLILLAYVLKVNPFFEI